MVSGQLLKFLVYQNNCLSCLSLSSLPPLHSFPPPVPSSTSRLQCLLPWEGLGSNPASERQPHPHPACLSLPDWVLLLPTRALAISRFGPGCQGLKYGLFLPTVGFSRHCRRLLVCECLSPRNLYKSKWALAFLVLPCGGEAPRGNWVEVSGAGLDFLNLAA